MNLTNAIERISENNEVNTDFYKSIGFKSYKREITLFLKESKNINAIVGHNLVTKINGMITNYSIVDDLKEKCRVFIKTVYVCEVEFPNHITLDSLKRSINSFVSVATIKPVHGFTNTYVVYKDRFEDLGISLADLTIRDKTKFNIVNMSKIDTNNEFYKFLIYKNKYNPKFYNSYDCTTLGTVNLESSWLLSDLYDNNTKLICNTHGDETVQNFINNNAQTGIYINKRIIAISDIFSELFNKLLFVSIENLEFVYNSSSIDKLNITKLKLFANFRNDLSDYICNEIKSIIDDIIQLLNKHFKDNNCHFIFSINNQFAIIDMNFLDENKEIRITKPLYKLYGEFSLDSEFLIKDLEANGEIAKLEYIEQSIKGLDKTNNIRDMIDVIDNVTKTYQLLVSDMKNNYRNLIGEDIRCLENESSQKSLRHQNIST